ncbi:hypothetical protein [Burkholderia pyrrocinia]
MPRTEERASNLHPDEFGHDALAHDAGSDDGRVASSRLDRERFHALRPRSASESRIAQWRANVHRSIHGEDLPPAWVSHPESSRLAEGVSPLPGAPAPFTSAPPGRRPVGAMPSRHGPTANDDHAHYAQLPSEDGRSQVGESWMPMPPRSVSPISSLHERHTPFPSRPVTPSTTFDPSDRDTRAGTSAFTDRATYDASSNWQDPSFQNDFTPGMQRPGQPRRPGMNAPDNRWTSRLRPWENVIEGGASVMAMMARTIISVVQSIAQIFEKWGDALVSLTRR